MMVKVVAGKYNGTMGIKLALTDKTMTFFSLDSHKVVRVPRKSVRQMILLQTSPEDPDFTQEPTDSELQMLWRFVQSRYDKDTHTFCANSTRKSVGSVPIKELRKMYREQPPLITKIRVVPCYYTQ